MDGFDSIILEVLNLKGLSVLDSPRLFVACLADVSGTKWQHENALLKRNCDQRFLACFADNKVEDEKTALFARANAITILRDDYGLAEARAVELADFLIKAVCAYKAIALSTPPVESEDSYSVPAKSISEAQLSTGKTTDADGEAKPKNSVSIGEIKLPSANDIIASFEKEREEEKAAKKQAVLEVYKSLVELMTDGILKNKENRNAIPPNRETVEFGRYPMGALNNKKPIEWLVLDRNESGTLLISKCVLDARKFDADAQGVWETSDIRRWLNGEFIKNAFSSQECEHILYAVHDEYLTLQTTHSMFGYESLSEESRKAVFAERAKLKYTPGIGWSNYDRICPESSYELGKVISDRIYVLSAFEAQYYFKNKNDLIAPPSGRLKRRLFSGNYWLRSSESGYHYVTEEGAMLSGHPNDGFGVRPMIWVNHL